MPWDVAELVFGLLAGCGLADGEAQRPGEGLPEGEGAGRPVLSGQVPGASGEQQTRSRFQTCAVSVPHGAEWSPALVWDELEASFSVAMTFCDADIRSLIPR